MNALSLWWSEGVVTIIHILATSLCAIISNYVVKQLIRGTRERPSIYIRKRVLCEKLFYFFAIRFSKRGQTQIDIKKDTT